MSKDIAYHYEDKSRNKLVAAYLLTGGLVIGLMMVFGILMLLNQGGILNFLLQPFINF